MNLNPPIKRRKNKLSLKRNQPLTTNSLPTEQKPGLEQPVVSSGNLLLLAHLQIFHHLTLIVAGLPPLTCLTSVLFFLLALASPHNIPKNLSSTDNDAYKDAAPNRDKFKTANMKT